MSRWRRAIRRWCALAAIVLGTCLPAAAATLTLASGAGQTATVATAVAQPFVVSVTDAFTNPVAGVTVNWAISVGGGALSVPSSVTDAAGLASTSYTTGSAPGGCLFILE